MNVREEIRRLVEAVDYVRACMAEIHEAAGDDPLTGDQQARFDEGRTFVEATREQLDRLYELRDIEIAVGAGGGLSGSDGPDKDFAADDRDLDPDPPLDRTWDLDEVRRALGEGDTGSLRSKALAAVERMQGLSDAQREHATATIGQLTGGLDDVDSFGARRSLAHVVATSSAEYARAWVKAFKAACRGGVDPDAMGVLSRAASLTDAAGGFAIPQQLDPTLIAASDGSVDPIGAAARKVVATGDVWQGLTGTNVAFSYDAEAVEVSDDTPTWAGPSISIHKAQASIPFSIEIGMDYPGFTDDLQSLLAMGRDDAEATVHATGTGTNQPIGVVTALTGAATASAGANALAWGDVTGLINGLPARHRARARGMGHVDILHEIRADAIGAGYTVDVAGSLNDPRAGSSGFSILGVPLDEASAMDGTYGSGENYVLVVGDFQHYVVANRIGMSLELVPHLLATANNLPSGQRAFYAYYRSGADSVLDGAFGLLNVT